MAVPKEYQEDVEAILSKRNQHGADLWTTSDRRLGKGSPFSTVDCVLMLTELGMSSSDPVLKGCSELLLDAWREDGRFRIAPKGTIYPCHTANIARMLCRLGFADDQRLAKTFQHLFEIQHEDGGWRCNKSPMGRGEIGDRSNPGVTLWVLDAFRFSPHLNRDERLDQAVLNLLEHWEVRRPLGPCSFGIGSLFMQTEFPFLRYNLFYYVYVLSFYDRARRDNRFAQALATLESKIEDGKMVIENPHRYLGKLAFCKRGQPSAAATRRYREILQRI